MISNISKSIESKRSAKLHNKQFHPINLIKERIYHYFLTNTNIQFKTFDNLPEFATVENNFDLLLIPKNHPSRSLSDTYYLSENEVLRTHTSAHQNELLKSGEHSFLVTGDVYRKDEIDKFHFPVFHQMEGVHIVDENINPEEDLKNTLAGLVNFLFPNKQYRFNNDYFPFTNPSYEIEVLLGDKWVEILGCGVIQSKILENNNITKKGWAFGLGLERLAMLFYEIPDIRLFWTNDTKFLSQFENKTCFDNIKFTKYSNLNPDTRDISFWLNSIDIQESDNNKIIWLKENDFYDIVRNCFDTNIENIQLIDEFFHPKKSQYSRCYRMTLSPNNNLSDPSEFTILCNKIMLELRDELINKMTLDVRG